MTRRKTRDTDRQEAPRTFGMPPDQGPLTYDQQRSELISKSAHLAYPVRDGIPIMLPSEGRAIED